MSDNNYYKGPCAHCNGTGWHDYPAGVRCWRCQGEGTAIRSKEETENGEHRTADTPASGGAAEQPGGGAGQAATDWGAHYYALRRAGYDHTLASVAIANAQQRTGLMGSLLTTSPQFLAQFQALASQQQALQNVQGPFLNQQNMQNAPWANQYNGPFGMPYMPLPSSPLVGAFTGGMAMAQGWVDPQPPKPVEDAGISAGEILGHRVWRSVGHLLQSMAQEHIWPTNGPLHAPEVGDHNSHGIHAFKTAEDVLNEYQPSRGFWGEIKLVYGTVALWGTVIEHERGYRGEFARIHSLDSIPQLYRWKELRLLRDLRQRYGLTNG